jgi:hypothetical protein
MPANLHGPELSSPRPERQPVCWIHVRLCCRVTFGCSLLRLRAAPLAANLARVPLLHHYVEACKLVGQRHGLGAMAMSQKVSVLPDWDKKQAAQLRVGFPDSPMWCHQATSVEATLNVMPASTSLVFELVEV